jgi:hypothetical protein
LIAPDDSAATVLVQNVVENGDALIAAAVAEQMFGVVIAWALAPPLVDELLE